MRNKRTIVGRNLRKEVAELIRQGKQGNARIRHDPALRRRLHLRRRRPLPPVPTRPPCRRRRVESAIREALTLQAYEVLELYLELLVVRAEMVARQKDMPPDMMEGLCSLVYAAPRMAGDLAELAVIRKMLASKYSGAYGKDFAAEASSDLTCRKWQVNDTLVACLSVEAPAPETKLQVCEPASERVCQRPHSAAGFRTEACWTAEEKETACASPGVATNLLYLAADKPPPSVRITSPPCVSSSIPGAVHDRHMPRVWSRV
jgi:hypothetical protein